MAMPVTVNVTGNSNDPMDGAIVSLECQDGIHSYEAAVSGGMVYWEEVWRGVYDMSVTMDGYEAHVENDMWITDTMVMNVELLENIYPPSNVAVDDETGLVTWEAPDGSIIPLDGYLDPYFQEVYLEAESIPIFSKLVRHMSADALDQYVHQLQKEVRKYLTRDINYGKAAKRMYNIFRLTGRYQDAAYLRELFDEPTTVLYQTWALIRTVDEADEPGSGISTQHILEQTDELIMSVIGVLEGEKESEIDRYLLRLRDSVSSQGERPMRTQEIEAARTELMNLVNDYFYTKLTSMPSIKAYMDDIQSSPEAGV